MSARQVDHLLIGGGLACGTAARTLRERTSEGSVLLVGREPDPPYERPPCSKGYMRGSQTREEAYVASAEWYAEHAVELLTRTSVTALDLATSTAGLSTGEQIHFEHALLATGANVRRLSVDGCELEGLHYLRTLGNTDSIRADAASADEVVMIGGSYIACEVAASLTAIGKRCSIVMEEEHTLERTFGKRAGAFFEDVLRSHGVRVHPADGLARFEGSGRVQKVVTQQGNELPAQLVVIGVGVAPDVRLARSAGLEIGSLGGVRCSAQLRASMPAVLAAGDMCEYDSPIHGRPMRLEHWDVAYNQGRTAALNMLGEEIAYEVVPYFFSDLADWVSLEYVGPAYEWDEEVLRGSFEDGAFTNFYLADDRVLAALTVARADDLEQARRLITSKAKLSASDRALLADADGDLAAIAS